MKVYSEETVQKVHTLRLQGLTYAEINQNLRLKIPKSTLSYLCKNIDPGEDYKERMQANNLERLVFIRELAVKKNKQVFESKLEELRANSAYASDLIRELPVAKIALAMLYLGEGGKWKSHRGLLLGSSDPRIIKIYINLLQDCYAVRKQTMRCRVQHRADQNGRELLRYWSKVTELPSEQFYPNYIDKRTIGKPSKKTSYKGVCVVTCPGTQIQLELDCIADIISDAWGISSVG